MENKFVALPVGQDDAFILCKVSWMIHALVRYSVLPRNRATRYYSVPSWFTGQTNCGFLFGLRRRLAVILDTGWCLKVASDWRNAYERSACLPGQTAHKAL